MKGLLSICGLVTLTLSFARVASAEQKIQVWGRGYHHSCVYYSSTDADFDVTLFNDAIPYGSTVTMVSGIGSDQLNINPHFAHWQKRAEDRMEAVNVSTWRVRRSGQINARGSQYGYSRIEFVFRVDAPGADPQWILPGSDGTYFVSGLELQNIRCVNSSDELPQFARLPLGKN